MAIFEPDTGIMKLARIGLISVAGGLYLYFGLAAHLSDIFTDRCGGDFYGEYFQAMAVTRSGAGTHDHEAMMELAETLSGRDSVAPNVYPPTFTFLFSPLTAIPHRTARVLWLVLNHVWLAGTILVLRRLCWAVAKHQLSVFFSLVFFFLSASVYFPSMEHNWQGQANLPVLFLLALALFSYLAQGRDAVGGLCLGLAIVLKFFPAVVLPFLICRRRYRLVAWTSLWCVCLAVASLSVVSIEDYLHYPFVLLDSVYIVAGNDLASSYSLVSWLGGWIRIVGLEGTTSGLIVTSLRLLPYVLFLMISWMEARREDDASNQALTVEVLRYWQALLFVAFIMSKFWEHHLVFLLAPIYVLATLTSTNLVGKGRIRAAVAASIAITGVPGRGNVHWMRTIAVEPGLRGLGLPVGLATGFKFVGILILVLTMEFTVWRLKQSAPRRAFADGLGLV
ncbi:glycosyltransferase family 87 protein [Acidobacteriota bacterium]